MEEGKKLLMADGLILVYYIDVRNVKDNNIPKYMNKVAERIKSNSLEVTEMILIPIMGETRIECINPKYINEPELIREHRLKMDRLHEIIDIIIKNDDNGKNME